MRIRRHYVACAALIFVSVLRMQAQSEKALLSFKYPGGGGFPISTLLFDSGTQSFYGTTSIGGANNNGTVFRLKQSSTGNWTETVLYSFKGILNSDCSGPNYGVTPKYTSGVIAALYGTYDFGGQNDQGAVFVLTASSTGGWNEKIIYSFQGGNDGANPRGGVVIDAQGKLYGTTNV